MTDRCERANEHGGSPQGRQLLAAPPCDQNRMSCYDVDWIQLAMTEGCDRLL
jgi:hypothetical protein